jgi:hypothetical protein
MKTLSYLSLMGPSGERGWWMLPHPRPRLPVGGRIFLVYIPVGENLPHPLLEEFPTENRGSRPHCHHCWTLWACCTAHRWKKDTAFGRGGRPGAVRGSWREVRMGLGFMVKKGLKSKSWILRGKITVALPSRDINTFAPKLYHVVVFGAGDGLLFAMPVSLATAKKRSGMASWRCPSGRTQTVLWRCEDNQWLSTMRADSNGQMEHQKVWCPPSGSPVPVWKGKWPISDPPTVVLCTARCITGQSCTPIDREGWELPNKAPMAPRSLGAIKGPSDAMEQYPSITRAYYNFETPRPRFRFVRDKF